MPFSCVYEYRNIIGLKAGGGQGIAGDVNFFKIFKILFDR
jgi:hypothetical protein